jgi:hypothetical protein
MGLNLNINRIIFAHTSKRNNDGHRDLNEFEIRQIAGRAGRNEKTGFVNCIHKKDLVFVRTHFTEKNSKKGKKNKTGSWKKNQNENEVILEGKDFEMGIFKENNTNKPSLLTPTGRNFKHNSVDKKTKNKNCQFEPFESLIEKAILFPPLQTISDFANFLFKFNKNEPNETDDKGLNNKKNDSNPQNLSLIETLKKFEILATVGGLYQMRNLSDIYEILEIFQDDMIHLDIQTQYAFASCPINSSETTNRYFKLYLKQFVKEKIVRLPEDFHLENRIFKKKVYKFHELKYFEEIYNILEVYVWLSYKYEKEFIERELANVLKDRISKIIDSILKGENFNLFADLRSEKQILDEENVEESTSNSSRHSNKKLIVRNKATIYKDDKNFI